MIQLIKMEIFMHFPYDAILSFHISKIEYAIYFYIWVNIDWECKAAIVWLAAKAKA